MRNLFLSLLLLLSITTSLAKINIDRTDPPCWWTGMQNRELQIMLYGNNITNCNATIDYPGVTLSRIEHVESPNYLFLYLDVAPETQAGTFDIQLTRNREKAKIPYTIYKRSMPGSARQGFDASDVLYLIMPDRFADGDPATNVIKSMRFPTPIERNNPNARHGGDLKGIADHLDYIESLGVTAIWLNPVLENDMPGGAYHGYATTNYYRIDPRFGTNEYYRELIDECHRRDLKVVMDMIFNHCGDQHIWFLDRPTHDWFNFPNGYEQTSYRLTPHFDPYVSEYDKHMTTEGWFVESMPDLNQHNPHLMKYLIQNSIWWIEYAGIDGIRMDTHPYVFFDSMAEWCKQIDQEYPHFNIVGECWYGTEVGTAYWQRNSRVDAQRNSYLKSVMDFPLQGITHNAFTSSTIGTTGLNLIYDHIALDFLYTDPMNVLIFLDNHDTDRFLLSKPENLGFYKQAIAFLLTTRGIPQIYYGTEVLMHGTKAVSDGLVRLDFPGGFPGDTINDFITRDRTPLQNEAFAFCQKILKWRKGNNCIAQGDMKHFMPNNGLYVYRRSYDGKNVLVIMNGNDTPLTVDMTRYNEILSGVSSTYDIITNSHITFTPTMEFAPRALWILEY